MDLKPELDDRESIRSQIEAIDTEISENDYQITLIESRQEQLKFQRELLAEKLDVKKAALAKQLSSDFDGTDFPWSKELYDTLMTKFKIKELRPQQLPTINATMSGHDCILIMPTGGGKSLCFQLPALLSQGITLVVSPLVSLMEDQFMALQKLDINAKILTASTPKAENKNIMQEMINPKTTLKILYVTPEKLSKSKMFLSRVQKMYGMGLFARLAIDEVHCCSQWGHDFRRDYKILGVMKRQFPNVPVLGLTATATTRVVHDVQKMLSIENCLVFRAHFNRPNLIYKIFPKPTVAKEVTEELAKIIRNSYAGQSGIVYCLSIKETEEVAVELQKQGIKARPYHANLDPTYRSNVHSDWVANKMHVMVATIAFGMGIDKPDVRFVIHHTMSRTIENYYQESGRAGRDNKPADCITFYRFGDHFRQSGMVITESQGLTHLYAMLAFCVEQKRCHRATLADHFGELWNAEDCNKMCDNCNPLLAYGGSRSKLTEKVDVADYCRDLYKIIDAAKALKQNLTALKLMDAWLSKGKADLRVPGVTKPAYSRATCERIVAHLLLEGYLQEKFNFTAYNTISYLIKGLRAGHVNKKDFGITMDLIKMPGFSLASSAATKLSSTVRQETSKTANEKSGKRPCVVNAKLSKFSRHGQDDKKASNSEDSASESHSTDRKEQAKAKLKSCKEKTKLKKAFKEELEPEDCLNGKSVSHAGNSQPDSKKKRHLLAASSCKLDPDLIFGDSDSSIEYCWESKEDVEHCVVDIDDDSDLEKELNLTAKKSVDSAAHKTPAVRNPSLTEKSLKRNVSSEKQQSAKKIKIKS